MALDSGKTHRLRYVTVSIFPARQILQTSLKTRETAARGLILNSKLLHIFFEKSPVVHFR
jgi:hypothetical protein